MQHFQFVNWWIGGFVFWCHEQVIEFPSNKNLTYNLSNTFVYLNLIIHFSSYSNDEPRGIWLVTKISAYNSQNITIQIFFSLCKIPFLVIFGGNKLRFCMRLAVFMYDQMYYSKICLHKKLTPENYYTTWLVFPRMWWHFKSSWHSLRSRP